MTKINKSLNAINETQQHAWKQQEKIKKRLETTDQKKKELKPLKNFNKTGKRFEPLTQIKIP